MIPLCKAIAIGFVSSLIGLILLLFIPKLEHYGLEVLFKLRGPRQVPSDVLIVTLDHESADKLEQPDKTEKWSRSIHAHLINTLAKEGASVIAFDIFFEEAKTLEHDQQFAQAIKNAGNVVLFSHLNKPEQIRLPDEKGDPSVLLHTEKIKPPTDILAKSALASVPFPLPEEQGKLSRYWVIKPEFGDMPTFPVVVFQIHALEVYDDFIRMLKKITPSQVTSFPQSQEEIIKTKGVEQLIQDMKDLFRAKPFIAQKLREELERLTFLNEDPNKIQLLRSLLGMYHGKYYHYLDYYGPRGTIPTIPCHQIIKPQEKLESTPRPFELRGKAVFVGCATRLRPVSGDEYDFPYSKTGKEKIKGVEVAATAFANLLENRSVRLIDPSLFFLIISLWSILLGLLCICLPSTLAAASLIGLCILYLMGAEYQFSQTAIWYPLFVPIFIQAPLIFIGSVFWKYRLTQKEKKHIRIAFEHYLPKQEVDRVSKNGKSSGQSVYGTILSTDAEQYTSLADEIGDPEEFSRFMNAYYDVVFEPVMKHGGIVSDVKGDEMLAIWATSKPDTTLNNKACLAALEIARAVERFNLHNEKFKLPTRMGLHSGRIILGSIGAREHYEYRAVGDIVIAATRLEGLNKYLGTQILSSEEVLKQLDGFLIREVGKFLLVGKSKPIVVYELICRHEEANEKQITLCRLFSEALWAYKRQSWEEAINCFCDSLRIHGKDGPSSFYLDLCEKYREKPPDEMWDDLIRLDRK